MTEKLTVVGQGYVGLPLAITAVEAGFAVVGLEIDEFRSRDLVAGRSVVEDISSDRLNSALSTGRYQVSTEYLASAGFDIAVVTVPTPLKEGGLPDLSMIASAARGLAPQVRRGATVILESTTYPGTTEALVAPLLEEGSGLMAGADFHLGYSPERIDPGNAEWTFVNTPKVVAGLDDASLRSVQAFYDRIVDRTVAVSTCRVAELTKLLENTFRHVNIALVNELAIFAHELGINVWEAIDAASTKPFGYLRFTPGPGVGGHCLPVDPSYLSWEVKRTLGHSFRFVELANDINDHMPDYVVRRVISLLNDQGKAVRGSRLLLLGLAYKRNTGDGRCSPAVRVAELLLQLGADVVAADAHVQASTVPPGVSLVHPTPKEFAAADLAILLTDHDELVEALSRERSAHVLDTRHRIASRAGVTLL